MSPPRLSLAMIVRDEAELLPRFLEHARGLYDELCVVDTGSRDRTLPLLQAAGARVIERPWTGDFAAARNQSLSLTTGDWVMFLDPDEWVSPELVQQARRLLVDDSAGAATLRMVNRLPHGHRREASLLRMFRRDPEIQFEHAIHEDLTRTLQARLQRTGQRLVTLSGAVEHVGYVRAHAAARNKETRDRTLLQACLEKDGLDLYSHFKLLELERFWSRWQNGRDAAQRAHAALEQVSPRTLSEAHFGGELLVMIANQLFPSDARSALDFLARWESRVRPSAALALRQGELLEQAGELGSARASFAFCLDLKDHCANLQLTSTRPLLGLARLALTDHRLLEAESWVDRALGQAPHDPEALLAGAALAHSRRGGAGLHAWEQLRRTQGSGPELDWALGEEALARGDSASARVHFEDAGLPLDPLGIGRRLAQVDLVDGQLERALTRLQGMVAEYPQAGIGVLLCELILGRASTLDLNLELEDAEHELRDWTQVLRWTRRSDLLSVLHARSQSVAELFPRWPRELQHALRALGGHRS